MTKYYILRHAQTYASKHNVSYGDGEENFNTHILPEGIPPIERVAKFFKEEGIDRYISSEYIRCKETARIISKATGMEFVFDKRLNEYLNESSENLLERLKNFLEDIESKGYNSVALCTHGAVIAAIKHLLIRGSLQGELLYDYPPPGILLIIDGKKIHELNFNIL